MNVSTVFQIRETCIVGSTINKGVEKLNRMEQPNYRTDYIGRMNNLNSDFNLLYMTEGIFDPEYDSYVSSKALKEFEERFNSLYRFWIINTDFIYGYLKRIDAVSISDYEKEFNRDFDGYKKRYSELSEEDKAFRVDPDLVFFEPNAYDIGKENVNNDLKFFIEHLRLSTISNSLSLLENFLGSLADEISSQENITVELSQKGPYIDQYLAWLKRGLGFELAIDKPKRKELDALRAVRNRYIHRINRDLPERIKKVINEMLSEAIEDDNSINDEFVIRSFECLAELVKLIELSYFKYQNER